MAHSDLLESCRNYFERTQKSWESYFLKWEAKAKEENIDDIEDTDYDNSQPPTRRPPKPREGNSSVVQKLRKKSIATLNKKECERFSRRYQNRGNPKKNKKLVHSKIPNGKLKTNIIHPNENKTNLDCQITNSKQIEADLKAAFIEILSRNTNNCGVFSLLSKMGCDRGNAITNVSLIIEKGTVSEGSRYNDQVNFEEFSRTIHRPYEIPSAGNQTFISKLNSYPTVRNQRLSPDQTFSTLLVQQLNPRSYIRNYGNEKYLIHGEVSSTEICSQKLNNSDIIICKHSKTFMGQEKCVRECRNCGRYMNDTSDLDSIKRLESIRRSISPALPATNQTPPSRTPTLCNFRGTSFPEPKSPYDVLRDIYKPQTTEISNVKSNDCGNKLPYVSESKSNMTTPKLEKSFTPRLGKRPHPLLSGSDSDSSEDDNEDNYSPRKTLKIFCTPARSENKRL